MSKRHKKIGGSAADTLRLRNGSGKNQYTGIVTFKEVPF